MRVYRVVGVDKSEGKKGSSGNREDASKKRYAKQKEPLG